MPESHVQSRFAEVKDADALFKGTISLEHSGYWPMSNPAAREKTLQLSPGELRPGLLECMAACIPFRQVFTHGDCGIFARAYTLVNKKEPSMNGWRGCLKKRAAGPGPVILKIAKNLQR